MGFAHPQSGPRTFCFQMRKGARPGRLASRAALRSLTCRRWAAETTPSCVERHHAISVQHALCDPHTVSDHHTMLPPSSADPHHSLDAVRHPQGNAGPSASQHGLATDYAQQLLGDPSAPYLHRRLLRQARDGPSPRWQSSCHGHCQVGGSTSPCNDTRRGIHLPE